MRAFLAARALACGLTPSPSAASDPAVRVAQMARDVIDAVRKQRAEWRARSQRNHHQSTEGTKR